MNATALGFCDGITMLLPRSGVLLLAIQSAFQAQSR
jgi:hypothetical protein